MKLYLFQCGMIKSQKHLFTIGQAFGEPFDVPVPFFLIEHEKGMTLFDMGNALPVARDSV
jgi:N-acyl homoserine lactone hydrolase